MASAHAGTTWHVRFAAKSAELYVAVVPIFRASAKALRWLTRVAVWLSEGKDMPGPRESRKKVLVVDDSQSIREEVAAVLKPAGFEVLQAFDGLDGLNRILSTPDLAVVVADINMPRMTGLEMLTRIKGDQAKASLPIVMLTTEGKPDMIAQAKQAGAKGWMVKPFKPELLVALVCKFAGT